MYRPYIAGILFSFILLPYSLIFGGQQSGDKADYVGFFRINPLNSLTLGWVHLSTTYPVGRYTFPNQDGTFADKGSNFYMIGTGEGSISSFIVFNYDLRINTIEGARFKKGSVFLRSKSVSLEIGRNNFWLGHGNYGSLLLSNNAEPYTLVRFRTEQPFRIPYLGNFNYSIFHGWPRNFNILGHYLRWYPASWFELNLKQTTMYTGNYSFPEYLKMFTGREANIDDGLGETNSRAAFGLVVHAGLVRNVIPFIKDMKLHLEYGGEDIYAIWQTEDSIWKKDLWVGPFGFELLDTGILTGLEIITENSRFIFEYAQNYKSHYLFYDPYKGSRPYNAYWYKHSHQADFLNNGSIMGHHMGSAAEMFYFHYETSISKFTIFLDIARRHRWDIINIVYNESYKNSSAERKDSFKAALKYDNRRISYLLTFRYNYYKNVDINHHPLINNPSNGSIANDFLVGIELIIHI